MPFKKNVIYTFVVILLATMATSCSDVKQEGYIAPTLNKRILIISGESLNSVHDDPRINATLLQSTTNFSGDLRDELKKRGAVIIERFNNDQDKTTGTIIGELLTEINFDAVIRVALIQETNEDGDEMDLNISYNPLVWTNTPGGESTVKVTVGPIKIYRDVADSNIPRLALEYTQSLISEGAF